LGKAVASFGADKVDVQWKPFQIDPGTAEEGEEFEAYCRRRWGGSGWTKDLRRRGAPDGAEFKDWVWWPNTGRAHQWVQYGMQMHGLDSDRLNAVLFQALYEEGANLSLTETLVELGQKTFPNCDVAALRVYLQDNKGLAQVQQEIAQGRRKYNIRGVPYFVVGASGSNKPPYAFSGAQPASAFTEIFTELAENDE